MLKLSLYLKTRSKRIKGIENYVVKLFTWEFSRGRLKTTLRLAQGFVRSQTHAVSKAQLTQVGKWKASETTG